jgi:hypothetical protein
MKEREMDWAEIAGKIREKQEGRRQKPGPPPWHEDVEGFKQEIRFLKEALRNAARGLKIKEV